MSCLCWVGGWGLLHLAGTEGRGSRANQPFCKAGFCSVLLDFRTWRGGKLKNYRNVGRGRKLQPPPFWGNGVGGREAGKGSPGAHCRLSRICAPPSCTAVLFCCLHLLMCLSCSVH